MTRSPLTLPHRLDPAAHTCRAVVETPAGSRAKFDYDADSGLFLLAGTLPAGLAFPLDFGFVPGTRCDDGDPLDILILAEGIQPLPVGCLVTARLLGVIEAEQTEGGVTLRNDRLVARLAESRAFANVDSLDQLGEGFADELARFFTIYNELKGKQFEVLATYGPTRASTLVEQAAC
ncbi:MAG: inorganic diphosphatase [Pseudomonadota bacterium]|nr:inorganic diphosphatase [Pseudomonadota bacterium]